MEVTQKLADTENTIPTVRLEKTGDHGLLAVSNRLSGQMGNRDSARLRQCKNQNFNAFQRELLRSRRRSSRVSREGICGDRDDPPTKFYKSAVDTNLGNRSIAYG